MTPALWVRQMNRGRGQLQRMEPTEYVSYFKQLPKRLRFRAAFQPFPMPAVKFSQSSALAWGQLEDARQIFLEIWYWKTSLNIIKA
jgi:hypothetical protein